MTISWFSLAGRGFATGRRFYDFECFTYPAYKTAAALHLNSTLPDNMLLPVPEDDPAFLQLVFSGRETFFGFVWLFAPMLSAFVIGCAYVMIQHKRLAAQHRYQLVNL
jgi:hypothetical protein